MPKATQVNFSDIQPGDTIATILKSVGYAPEYFPPRKVIRTVHHFAEAADVIFDAGDDIQTTSIRASGPDHTVEFYRLDNPL